MEPPRGRQAVTHGLIPPQNPADRANLERVAGIFAAAELGRPEQMCDLFDGLIGRDLSLRALVEGRVSALEGATVAILPGGPDRADKYAADAFQAIWNRLDTDQLIAWHQFSALVYGWAASEIDWAWDSDDKQWLPRSLWHIRSRLFRIATEYWRVVPGAEPDELLVRTGPSESTVARMVADKWIVTRGAPYWPPARAGLMHACARYAILRTQMWANWFAFLRRYGLPFLAVKISSWADEGQQAQARDILRRWGEDIGYIIDKNSEIEPTPVDVAASARSANSDPQARFTESLHEEFTRLWTGIPTTGSGNVGDYHTNKTFAGIHQSVLRTDGNRVGRSLAKGLAEPWHRMNQVRGRPPRIVFGVGQKITDAEGALTAAERLNKIGFEIDPEQLEELTGLRIRRSETTAGNAGTDESEPIGDVDA